MEARTEKRRGSTGGGYTGIPALSTVNRGDDVELTEQEMFEKMEKEEEDKYFDEVLRINTGDDDGDFGDGIVEPRVVEILNDDDDDDEERYFDMVLQANTARPSAFPEIDDMQGSERGTARGGKGSEGGGSGSGGRVTEGVQSRSNSTFSAYDKAPPATVCTTQEVVDFTESLTMTAMEKGIPATPYSPALSKSRPSTSLSFASPSSNPFGKENRSKSDEEENLLQAALLGDSLLEKLQLKKLDDKKDNKSGERLDLSIFSSAATATRSAINDMKKNSKGDEFSWDNRQRPRDMVGTNTTEVEGRALDGAQGNTDLGLIPPVAKAPFRGVNGYPASIIVKGVRTCNLPDHHVTAGCTAIVALKSGNKLYVANAGM
jgi:hypothetical protein